NIRDLEQACFHCLDHVACLGHQRNDCAIRNAGDFHLALAYAYCFHDDNIEASFLYKVCDLEDARMKPAQRAAAGERADINLWVIVEAAHPDPVAEERSEVER